LGKNIKIKYRQFSLQYKNISDAKHQSMATLYLIKLLFTSLAENMREDDISDPVV